MPQYRYIKWLRYIIASLFCLTPFFLVADGIHYSVEFEGMTDDSILRTMRSISHLTSLKKRPPLSINALRYRAQSDIPELIKVLHSYGYYEGNVDIQIQEIFHKVHVLVTIDSGPLYHLENYQIHLYTNNSDTDQFQDTATIAALKQIGCKLGKPAFTKTILQSELQILEALAQHGFPLARIKERDIIVDGKTKTVRISIDINTGPKATFGQLTIIGTKKINPLYIEQNMSWKQARTYNSNLVEQTQNTLLASGLFSSVLITHDEHLDPQGQIPMKIEVSETRHKSVNIGISYQTVFGPGITFGWENRNVGKMGRRLSFQGDITKISHSGIGLYSHPNFLRIGQDYIWQGQAMHESLYAYSMRSYNIINRLDRKIGEKLRISGGILGERLYVTASEQNGNYWLLEVPIYLRYSTANDLLNPTTGVTLEWTVTPSIDIANPQQPYLINQFSESTYHPLNADRSVVIAQQLTIGSILSSSLTDIPLSKRYLGGSEQELRGYRYRTVSSLVDHKPIGGRSAIYFTLETRFRVSRTIGLVPFFDLGNVYKTEYPTKHGKWFKSTGLGLRYFSFIGPFRLDVAFPLDRRKQIDPVYRILVSIGQTF